MNDQERALLSRLLQQLQDVRLENRDADADAMIRDAVARQPAAAYLLVQRALLQDQALAAATARIEALERAAAGAPPERPGGFLSEDAWGRSAGGNAGRSAAVAAGSGLPVAAAAAPQRGLWDRLRGNDPQPARAAAAPGGGVAQPVRGGGSSFLGNMAATAAGVAGGAFLFQGISHLMGGQHAAGQHDAGSAAGLGATGDNLADYRPLDDAGAGGAPNDALAAPDDDAGADVASYDDGGGDFGGDDGGFDV